MNKDIHFSIFADEEESSYKKWQAVRDNLFKPVIDYLAVLGIKANWISYLGFLMVIPFIYFFQFNPWIAFIFILINLFLDGLDGALARKQGLSTIKGSIMDIAFDNLSFLIIFMTIFYYDVFNHFWGTLYICNYLVLLFLIAISRALRIKVFPVVRSRYYFYLMLFFFLVTGWNYFDYFMVLFAVYMTITNIFLFQRIRWSL